MQQIEDGIYIEETYQGISLGAVIKPLGSLIIDAPPNPSHGRSWRSAVRSMGGGVQRLLVNLDAHYDRTIGARSLETTVIAHKETANDIEKRSAIFKGQSPETGSEWESGDGLTGIRWKKPTLTFSEQALLKWGGGDIVLEHHPGPDPGAIWVIVPDAKVVFIGDAVLLNQPPFLFNANIPAWVDALDVLLSAAYKNYLVVCSRGGTVEKQTIREQRRFLREVEKRLERYHKRDAPPEEIEKTIPNLLSRIDFPLEHEEQYVQRLKHGLKNYYIINYLPPKNELGDKE